MSLPAGKAGSAADLSAEASAEVDEAIYHNTLEKIASDALAMTKI